MEDNNDEPNPPEMSKATLDSVELNPTWSKIVTVVDRWYLFCFIGIPFLFLGPAFFIIFIAFCVLTLVVYSAQCFVGGYLVYKLENSPEEILAVKSDVSKDTSSDVL